MFINKMHGANFALSKEPSADAIVGIFNQCFGQTYNVEISGGADEPLYTPATSTKAAQLIFRENFPASALHEAAHWCIAGELRRNSTDFALTYIAAPRSETEQEQFLAAEVRTQSLESIFAAAANVTFNPSADNLDCDVSDFVEAIAEYNAKTLIWLNSKAGSRAMQFREALITLTEYGRVDG